MRAYLSDPAGRLSPGTERDPINAQWACAELTRILARTEPVTARRLAPTEFDGAATIPLRHAPNAARKALAQTLAYLTDDAVDFSAALAALQQPVPHRHYDPTGRGLCATCHAVLF